MFKMFCPSKRKKPIDGSKRWSLSLVGLGVAGHGEPPAVHGGDLHIDHLHGLELFEHAARGQPRSALLAPLPEGHVQAVGEERDEDVRLDLRFELMVDGADRQVPFEVTEGFLHLGKLDVVLP